MARDRDDDRFDDEIGDAPRPVDRTAARRRVAVPAIFLIVLGFLGTSLGTITLAVALVAPDWFGNAYADAVKPLIEKQPPSQARDDQLAQIEQVRQLRLDTPVSLASTGLGLVTAGVMLVGGLRMRGLKSYGLAVTASLAALYPCGCIACFAVPVGLWALITLLNGDVKAAFAAGGKLPLTPDGD